MVSTAFLLGARYIGDVVENKPESSLVVPLGKALNGTPLPLCGRQVAQTYPKWQLPSGNFLQRFRYLLLDIKAFLHRRDDDYAKLDDLVWMNDLAFLADFTGRLSALNLQLQGKSKSISELKNRFNFFPNIKNHLQNYPHTIWNPGKYVTEIHVVSHEFEARFSDFKKIEGIVEYMSYPFKSDLNVSTISRQISEVFSLESGAVEMEILTMKADVFLKARASENDFWKFVDKKHSNIKKCAQYIHSCFGSTYLSESAFSFMNAIKTKQRSVLTNCHLSNCLMLSLTGYKPEYDMLVKDMVTQISH